MLTSTCYYRNCKLADYHMRLRELEETISSYVCGTRIRIKLCALNDTDVNDVKKDALERMRSDYHDRKCKLTQKTLFDLCIRDNIASFKSVFSTPGTRNTLNTLYMYLSNLPKRIKVRNKSLVDLDDFDNYYVKYYINLYLPYDLITILLENYADSTTMDRLTFLEILIDELFQILKTNFN